MRIWKLAPVAALAACTVTMAASNPYPPIPPLRVETIPRPPVSGEPLLWQPGHYEWNGAGYVWYPGQYVPAAGHGNLWQPGFWQQTPNGWVWQPGRWV
jgi:hypothetical protein